MKTLLINLDRSSERLAEFYRINPPLGDLVRFPAVDGRTIDRQKLVEKNIFTEAIATRYSPGAIGCALSHLRVWQTAMDLNEPVTAVEDDAILHRDFENLSAEAVRMLPPDWDLLMWGWNFDSVLVHEMPGGTSVNVCSFIDNKIAANRAAYQGAPLCPNPCRLIAGFGTVGYAVSPDGARKLTDLALPFENFILTIPGLAAPIANYGIDTVMNRIYPRLKAYVCMPPLILTANDTAASTVAGS